MEKSLSSLKKYYDYDDTEHRGKIDIENLFNGNLLSKVDEDYYKLIKTRSAFSGNYVEYESKGDKSKNLSPKKYLDIITPYLHDMINDHETQGEWKIQLIMQTNFYFF